MAEKNSKKQDILLENTKKEVQDYDDFLDRMGVISRYQVFSALGSTSLCFTVSMMTIMPIFLTATPDFRCNYWNETVDTHVVNQVLPTGSPIVNNLTQDLDACSRYKFTFTNCSETTRDNCVTKEVVHCDVGYHFDRSIFHETIVTEWKLVCDRKILKYISNSLFFFGFFLGSIVCGVLADWVGRRKTLLIICLVYVGSGIGISFSPNFFIFLLFYVLSAAVTIGGYIVCHTYIGEISNTRWRKDLMLMNSLAGAFGNVFIAPLAYFFRDWRTLQLVCSLLALIYVPVYWFTMESPRWLLSVGRYQEAKAVLQRYSRSLGVGFEASDWKEVVENERNKRVGMKREKHYSILDLFKYPNIRLLSINIIFSWFGTSLVYYGLLLNIGNLAGDPYINTAVNSSMDVLSALLTVFLTRCISKPKFFFLSSLLAGFSCLGSMMMSQLGFVTAGVVLACIGRLGASGQYKLIYIITPEIYPTVVRGIGMSLGSLSARVGGMITPFTIQVQESIPWLTQTIFGVIGLISGVTALGYPNTDSKKLLTSLEEAEEHYAASSSCSCFARTGRRRSNGENSLTEITKDSC